MLVNEERDLVDVLRPGANHRPSPGAKCNHHQCHQLARRERVHRSFFLLASPVDELVHRHARTDLDEAHRKRRQQITIKPAVVANEDERDAGHRQLLERPDHNEDGKHRVQHSLEHRRTATDEQLHRRLDLLIPQHEDEEGRVRGEERVDELRRATLQTVVGNRIQSVDVPREVRVQHRVGRRQRRSPQKDDSEANAYHVGDLLGGCSCVLRTKRVRQELEQGECSAVAPTDDKV
mmetsp:Transcript_6098/g.18155  ORF Transcript_6098/g.18155 Transcript_6098/m.18155 type:complete len:235 (-) Transcript_6098:230-934(-)